MAAVRVSLPNMPIAAAATEASGSAAAQEAVEAAAVEEAAVAAVAAGSPQIPPPSPEGLAAGRVRPTAAAASLVCTSPEVKRSEMIACFGREKKAATLVNSAISCLPSPGRLAACSHTRIASASSRRKASKRAWRDVGEI